MWKQKRHKKPNIIFFLFKKRFLEDIPGIKYLSKSGKGLLASMLRYDI